MVSEGARGGEGPAGEATADADGTAAARRPFVSVVVPVYRGDRRLRCCLGALEAQTYPRSRYEVIVVDNGGNGAIDRVVTRFAQARLIAEARPGSYAARNAGIAVARGEVIAFTDTDCTPASDWIEQGVRALLEEPGRGLVAGRVETYFRDPARPTAVERYSSLAFHLQKRYVEAVHFGETSNLFTLKAVLDDVGPFDAELKSHGDVAWGKRVFERGYKQVYAHHAAVLHPATHNRAELRARVKRLVGGLRDMRRREAGSPRTGGGYFLHDLGRIYQIAARIVSDDSLRPSERLRVLLVLLEVLLVAGAESLRLRLGGSSRR